MKTLRLPLLPKHLRPATLALACACASPALHAAGGRWATQEDGDWATAANWAGGVVAGGADATATFDAAIPRTTHVNVDRGRIIGHLFLNSKQQWQFTGDTITLAVSNPDESPTITVSNGHQYITNGIAGRQGFVKRGGSNLYLSGDSSYIGVTYIEGGQVYIRRSSSLGAFGPGNGTIVSHTGQLHLDRNVSIADDILLFRTEAGGNNSFYNDAEDNTLKGLLMLERGGRSAGAYTFGIQVTAGSLTLAGPVTGRLAENAREGSAANNANTLSLRTKIAEALVNITGVISDGTLGAGGLSLTKTDPGTLRLAAANTYTGATLHNGGVLLVDNTEGSGTGAGSVTIGSGTILGGSGTLRPSGRNGIDIAAGAIVSPGKFDARGAANGDRLTFALGSTIGGVTFQDGARLLLDCNASSSRVEGLAFTGLTAGPARVVFNNTVVNFSANGGRLRDGLYTLASFDAPSAYSGQLVLGSGLEGYNATLLHNAESIQLKIDGRAP